MATVGGAATLATAEGAGTPRAATKASPAVFDVLSDSAEIGRFHGHTTPVLSLSYSPQANLLLTGGDDETIRLFDTRTRSHISAFQSADWLPSPVRAVALSPDGTRAFIAARENVVKCVRLGGPQGNENDRPMRFEGHEHWIRSLSLNWEARRLVTAANDASLRIWDIESGDEIRRINLGSRGVSVAVKGRFIAVGSHSPVVRMFALDDDLAPPREFTGHTDWVTSVSIGERLLLSGSADTTARVFDLDSQECLHVLRGHTHTINAVAMCSSEKRAVTGANDSSVIYWSLDNGGAPLIRISSNFGSVRAVTFLRTPNEVCFSGWDGSIRVYDLHHMDRMRILAICSAGHERLGKGSTIRKLVHRDLLTKIRGYMYMTAATSEL